jgi:hypothetical protein
MVAMYAGWVSKYPIAVLEDGLAEDDWAGWKLLNHELGGRIELVGDDIFVTNVERIHRGINENVANAVLIQPVRIPPAAPAACEPPLSGGSARSRRRLPATGCWPGPRRNAVPAPARR